MPSVIHSFTHSLTFAGEEVWERSTSLLIPRLCKNGGHKVISKNSIDSYVMVIALISVDWKYLLIL